MDLIKTLEDIAKKKTVKVVVCEGWDERCLKASADVLKNKLANLILLGNPSDINKKAKELNVDISKAEIVDFKNSELKQELAEKLVELRKHKGMTLEDANKLLEDENYFGCMYCYGGYADAVAGSAIGSTAELMRPTLQILREKGKIVSEVMILNDVKNKRIIFASDASLNINPSSEELAQIALNAADVVKGLKLTPKIALLSFSTKGSGGDGPEVQNILEAVKIAKKEDSKLMIDGEYQVDAAVNKEVAKRKCPDSKLKGEANTLIFPNLTSANIFAHGLGQFSDMEIEFTVLSGLAKPVVILGRSTPMEAVRNMIVSCAMQVK